MKYPFRSLLAAAVLIAAVPQTHAAFVFTLSQVGPDVVVAGNGTLNLTGLNSSGATSVTPYIGPVAAVLYAGPAASDAGTFYYGVSGPASFGTGSITLTTGGTGNLAGISNNFLLVPAGYASGSVLSDTAIFTNATFSTLGFTPGTYTYTWGAGATADSLTVTSVVPEPSTWAMMLGGAGLLGMAFHCRHPRQAV